MKSRGSAILIAFFLMTAIGGVAFGIGRIFILDNTISSLYENGAIAYYVAESGVEEGLIRYRFDTGYDLPAGASLENPMLFERVNVTNSVVSLASIDPLNNFVTATDQKIYDLNVTNRVKFYGNDLNNDGFFQPSELRDPAYGQGEGKIYHIARDNSVKIDISGINGTSQDLTLYLKMSNYRWSDAGPALDNSHAFVEAKATGASGFNEYKKVLAKNPNQLNITDAGSLVALTVTTDLNNFTKSNLINSIAGSALQNTSKSELTLKPVGCDIDIALVPTSGDVSSPWATIKSIGYYGDATRTLTAKIDRQSGTVYDLYDFVIYKHQ